MKPPFFVFAHLAKCGGITFIDVLHKNLEKRFYHDYGLLQDYQYTCEQMARIIALYPRYDAIASHRYSFDLPFDDPACPRTVHALAFVRDPVERTLSHYFFSRRRAGVDTLPVHLDLVSYFEEFDREPGLLPNYKNGQVRRLAGSGGLPRIEELIRAGHASVFPLHRFDDAMLVLEARFPKNFPDCAYHQVRNRTERGQLVPDPVRQLIARHQDADFALVRLAEQELDTQLLRFYPDPATLQAKRTDFAKRKKASLDEARYHAPSRLDQFKEWLSAERLPAQKVSAK
ncbi:MAG: hypothetical protein ABSH19_07860 [Opitutales bacterium]|jgi:hypothetical protein